jgi:hypothetical protein
MELRLYPFAELVRVRRLAHALGHDLEIREDLSARCETCGTHSDELGQIFCKEALLEKIAEFGEIPKPWRKIDRVLSPNLTFEEWAPIKSAPKNRSILVMTKNHSVVVCDRDSNGAWTTPAFKTVPAEELLSWCWIPGTAYI